MQPTTTHMSIMRPNLNRNPRIHFLDHIMKLSFLQHHEDEFHIDVELDQFEHRYATPRCHRRLLIITSSDISIMDESQDAYTLVKGAVISEDELPLPFRLARCNGIDMREMSVDELQHHCRTGSLDAVTYISFCLEQIRKVCSPSSPGRERPDRYRRTLIWNV